MERVQNTYSGRTSLKVSGAISDHHHRLEAILLLQNANNLSFSTTLSSGLTLIKASILAWIVYTRRGE